MRKLDVHAFYAESTSTVCYVVSDPISSHGAIVDVVYDVDQQTRQLITTTADLILEDVQSRGLIVDWVLETHLHPERFSAASYLKGKTGALSAVGSNARRMTVDQPRLGALLSSYDMLLDDGERFPLGELTGEVIHMASDNPGCVTYVIEDCAFMGDYPFAPGGTQLTETPDRHTQMLYRSVLSLPEYVQLYMSYVPVRRRDASAREYAAA